MFTLKNSFIIKIICLINLSFGLSPAIFGDEAGKGFKRPFRTALFSSLDRSYNIQKPLALDDRAGWVVIKDTLIGGYNDHFAMAYDISQKSVSWWLPLDAGLVTPIINAADDIILGTKNGVIYRVDPATGTVRWKLDVDVFVSRPPLFDGKNIYLLTLSQHLYAVDFASGAVKWIYDAGKPETLSTAIPAPMVNLADGIIIGLSNGEVQLVDKGSGKKTWFYNHPSDEKSSFRDVIGDMMVVGDHLFYARFDGSVISQSFKDNNGPFWTVSLPLITAATVSGDRIFVAGIKGMIYAYSLKTGKELWSHQTFDGTAIMYSDDQRLMCATSDGNVTVFDRETGEPLWFDQLGGRIAHKPLLYKDSIFLSTGLKNIYGYKF